MRDETRIIGTASGAVGLGAFAAAIGACCALPWAVALLGVTGAVALARLTFLLPYALFGAGLLLVIAFWSVYRPRAACANGTCSLGSRRPLRWIVWGAMVLVTGLAVVALTSA